MTWKVKGTRPPASVVFWMKKCQGERRTEAQSFCAVLSIWTESFLQEQLDAACLIALDGHVQRAHCAVAAVTRPVRDVYQPPEDSGLQYAQPSQKYRMKTNAIIHWSHKTNPMRPNSAAAWTGSWGHWRLQAMFGSAPWSNSRSTQAWWPSWEAISSGVARSAAWVFTWAPEEEEHPTGIFLFQLWDESKDTVSFSHLSRGSWQLYLVSTILFQFNSS